MNNTHTQLWETCLESIKKEIPSANFTTWFKQTAILKEEEGVIFIAVPNDFIKEWMITKYQKLILKSLVSLA